MTRWVLDAFAVVAWIENEPGAAFIKQMLYSSPKREPNVFVCAVNLGEAFYSTWRRRGRAAALDLRSEVQHVPWRIVPADDTLVWHAAAFKAQYRMSYADCFAVALADRLGATLVTNDPEIRQAPHGIAIEWHQG